MKYIDIHSHLNIAPLTEQQAEIIQKLQELEIGTMTVGVDLETSRFAVRLAEAHDFLFATVGQHPNDNPKEVFDYDQYYTLAQHPKVLAIGECGLDYFRLSGSEEETHTEKQRQKELFKKHIELAQSVQKPLMIHARPSKGTMDAYEDVLEILEKHPTKVGVNFHFFVGDKTIVDRALTLDATFSFDGPITFTSEYDEVIRHIPLTHIHAETDAPFAAPMPYRGQTNYPYYVPHIVQKIAQIKNIPEEAVRTQLLENFERCFKKA